MGEALAEKAVKSHLSAGLHAWPKLNEWLKKARQVLCVRNRLSNDALE